MLILNISTDALKNRIIELRYCRAVFIMFFNSNRKTKKQLQINVYQLITIKTTKLTHQQ